VFLYGGAEAVESYTFARTRSAIRSLLDLAPKEARVLRDGREETVPAEALKPGDIFVVRPGEALPTDGIIRAGTSTLDEAPVTGESVTVEKGLGAPVFAGTINRQGAQEEKGRAQRFIERFGRRYSPAVLGVAILLLAVPPLLGQPWGTWAVRAVVLLVAAAPCALVMSTPVAIAAGIGAAGRHGVLIKGGMHLENLGRIRVVAFDKTGTLTQGAPEVTTVKPLNGVDRRDVLGLAASLEQRSEHPLAQAIVRHARQQGVPIERPEAFEALTGAGARGTLRGETCFIGSPALFGEIGVPLGDAAARVSELQAAGQTVVLIGDRQGLWGLLALRDQVRPSAREAVAALRAAGIGQVVMLSGDNTRTAAAIARELGIAEVWAELKPADKVGAVQEIERRYGPVAMVGDGINDAPALAAATVGIAMGVAGTDAAIEAADVALMADDLGKAVYALRLGRRVHQISRQNIVFSLAILAALILTALVGVLAWPRRHGPRGHRVRGR
jgi:Cd2+/Zn2+-exporting ATPase